MPRYTLLLTGIVLLSLSLLHGCSGLNLKQPSPEISYYTLEYGVPAQRPAQLPVVLKIDRFTSAPHSSTDRMVYRDKASARNYYTYHRWRARPADLVGYFLGRDLQAGGRFKAVLSPGLSAPATHSIEGRVDEFMEWDNDSAWEAVITVTVTLLKEDEPDVSKRVVWQRQFAARRFSEHKSPESVAQAMSGAMGDISLQIDEAVYGTLSQP